MMNRSTRAGNQGSWPVVLAHGVVLLVVLRVFRCGKVTFAKLIPTGLDAVALIQSEIGFVLLFEGLWVIASRGRGGRLWLRLFIASHLLLYFFLLLNHGFFINTGYRVDVDLAVYAVTHLGTVWGIIVSGARDAFWLNVAAVLFGLLLARSLEVLFGRLSIEGPSARVTLVLPLIGVALLAWSPAIDPAVRQLSRNDVITFALSGVGPFVPEEQLASYMVEPEDLYQAPRLLSQTVERRPNIVLLILESTGAQVLSPSFGASDLSPNLAALARESVVVENAYSTVTHTSKALVGMLCGMIPRGEMKVVEAIEGNLPLTCLPKLLVELGYRTAFMQTALGKFENRTGLVDNLGFEHGEYRETLVQPQFEKLGYFGMDEFAMLEPAVRWASNGEPPFFLTVLTVTPHHPYETPGRESDAPPELDYLAALKHQDAFVGELYSRLKNAGALHDTLVIVAGDHGEAFGEHKIYEHDAVPYEEVVWTPVLLHGPEWLGQPRTLPGLRSHLDLLPTVLELLGAQWEGRLPGRSLLSSAGHDTVFVSCWNRGRCMGMRRGSTKIAYHFRRKPTEIYDLEQDPIERHDLAPTVSHGELARIEAEMLAFKLSVDAFWAQYPVRGAS